MTAHSAPPHLDRRALLALGGAATLGAGLAGSGVTAPRPAAAQGLVQPDDPAETVRLWPGLPPGAPASLPREVIVNRFTESGFQDRIATGIGTPAMTVFRPARPNGAALLIIPGGGYVRVVIDREGFECARQWAAAGVTCFVLRYRLPGDGWADRPRAALQDAQRALRLIRATAAAYGIDPARIGVMGFSAGGHLAASLATRHGEETYAPVDTADRLSARPDVAALLYPVIAMAAPHAHPGSRAALLGASPDPATEAANSPHTRVTAGTPPTFLLHAGDDPAVPVENSLMMYAALRTARIPAALHLFETGGHGFGLRRTEGLPVAAWPALFDRWAAAHGQM